MEEATVRFYFEGWRAAVVIYLLLSGLWFNSTLLAGLADKLINKWKGK